MRDIDLVKLPSEAVGSQREDNRAAVHLLLFACFSDGAEPACIASSSSATLIRFPVIFYLTPIYQVQVEAKSGRLRETTAWV
jgi:hypothetical protein